RPVRLSCPHLHRGHALQTLNSHRAVEVFSPAIRFSRSLFAPTPPADRCLFRIWQRLQADTATGAIDVVCSLRTQPQSTTPLAILQFDLNPRAFHPAYEVHDCLSV